MMQKVQHSRSIAKALSWRTVGSVYTFAIAFLLTGKIDLSTFIVGIEVVSKTFLYYIHERAWMRVRWGVAATPKAEQKAADPEASLAQPGLSAA